MNNHQLINQDSGTVEWYTPQYILDAARKAMGCGKFELDPASSLLANTVVQAQNIFTINDDGLDQFWSARNVWLNHPYSRTNNPLWVNKAIREYQTGRAEQICMITYASTSENWFQPLFQFPMCFLKGRVYFTDIDGVENRNTTKGSVITYMGPYRVRFAEAFRNLGSVTEPFYDPQINKSLRQNL